MGSTNYTKKIIDDYSVLDTETTGLSAYYDEIIEIGVLRVRSGMVVDQYSQLIHPKYPINAFITSLTGITNEMVAGMPSIAEVKDTVLSFVGADVIVGHNTSFDIRFLNAGFGDKIENEYIDTMQFARKVYPELRHHRLSDLAEYLGLSNNEHRTIADCITTQELYEAIKKTMAEKELQIEDLWAGKK
jgi:DNA polymerase III subunit epsilon